MELSGRHNGRLRTPPSVPALTFSQIQPCLIISSRHWLFSQILYRGGSTVGAMGRSAPQTAADQNIEKPAWVMKRTFDRPTGGVARPIKSRFHHPVSYSVTKRHQSVHATQWPKPVSIQSNCKKQHPECTKSRLFELKNRKIFPTPSAPRSSHLQLSTRRLRCFGPSRLHSPPSCDTFWIRPIL